MSKVILFGATGNLGKEIAKELVKRGYDLTIVVRNEVKAKSMMHITKKHIIANVCRRETLEQIIDNHDIVISALGKSISLNDKSKATFQEVDYSANTFILEEAVKAGAKKFIYVSAFHAEKYLHLEYFKAHNDFSERLKRSSIDYAIIKPPAIFCAFIDLIEMAKKRQLINIGDGDKRTNPIYEGDLAKIVVDSINQENCIVEAGGKTIYTRKELNEIVHDGVIGNKAIRTVPLWIIKMILPLIGIVNKNAYDKFAFFLAVMENDTVAPQIGEMTFEHYVKLKLTEQHHSNKRISPDTPI
jgi:uncharacterized protein YbjT (DUF2867 family)